MFDGCKDHPNKKDIQQVFIEKICGRLQKLFTMFDIDETLEQRDIADYNVYLQLNKLNYTDADIADHMSYTKQQLANLIRKFTF